MSDRDPKPEPVDKDAPGSEDTEAILSRRKLLIASAVGVAAVGTAAAVAACPCLSPVRPRSDRDASAPPPPPPPRQKTPPPKREQPPKPAGRVCLSVPAPKRERPPKPAGRICLSVPAPVKRPRK